MNISTDEDDSVTLHQLNRDDNMYKERMKGRKVDMMITLLSAINLKRRSLSLGKRPYKWTSGG